MDTLVQFEIPISGLREGVHQYSYKVNKDFFDCFEASPIEEGKLKVDVLFDKRPDMFLLTFDINGHVKTICDRCLEPFNLPIKKTPSLIVKIDENAQEEAEVAYISPEIKKLNIGKFIYEFIILSIPIIKSHDLADEACDEEMLKYLEPEEPEEPEEKAENPMWAALKKFKK